MSSDPSKAAPASPVEQLVAGQRLERYVILELVGKGGIGEVYAAYHPELNRKVAIKLLRSAPDGDRPTGHARMRMLREAQVIAKLSHPNVVVVHDVGLHDDALFLVMEFIDGGTVREWLEAAPRAWQEVLRVFVAAGRGLAAAHAAELVHRDFKPDNVMLDRQGHVRVTDFGLARSAQAVPPGQRLADGRGTPILPDTDDKATLRLDGRTEEHSLTGATRGRPLDGPSGRLSSTLDLQLTQEGARLGTPAYMAPEQLLGDTIGPATDQFSFCVSLYEGLYGDRPFEGRADRLMLNVLAGRIREPSKGTSVPGWVRKAVLKGLNADPAHRHASMAVLLASLASPSGWSRRRIGLVAIGLAALAVLGVGFVARRPAPDRCDGSSRIGAVWSAAGAASSRGAARRDDIQRAFTGSGHPSAAGALARVVEALDAYAAKWRAMYRETCESTRVSGVQSSEAMELRMSCLAQRSTALEALVEVLGRAQREIVDRAPFAIHALPAIEGCADLTGLRGILAPPTDPRIAVQLGALQGRMAEVKALMDAGRFKDGSLMGEPLVVEARSLGYSPSTAFLYYELSRGAFTDPRRAETLAKEALWLALESGDVELAAKSAGELAFLAGYLRTDTRRGLEWVRLGKSLLARRPSLRLELASLLNDEATVREVDLDLIGSIEVMRQALDLKRSVASAPAWDIALTLMNLAESTWRLNPAQESLDMNAQASAMLRDSLNPDHYHVFVGLSNRAEMLNDLGHFSEAESLARQALDGITRSMGESSIQATYPRLELGRALQEQGRVDAALPLLQSTYDVRVAGAQDDYNVAHAAYRLAEALARAGQHTRADALAEEAGRRFSAAKAPALAAAAQRLIAHRRH